MPGLTSIDSLASSAATPASSPRPRFRELPRPTALLKRRAALPRPPSVAGAIARNADPKLPVAGPPAPDAPTGLTLPCKERRKGARIMSSWEEEARQFLLHEEKEDDELFFFIIPAVLLAMQEEKRKKRKQSEVAAILDDYLQHKKKQIEKTVQALLEKRNLKEEYSLKKCLDTMDAMEELTDEEKAIAADVFKSDTNRQMFMY